MAVNRDVPADSWSIALSEVNIYLENKTGSDIDSSTTPVIIALTVFKNLQPDLIDTDITNDSIWQTYHYTQYCYGVSKSLIAIEPPSSPTIIPTGATFTEKGLWHTEAILTSAETLQNACDHSSNVDNALAMATRIPAGEHIAFAWVDANNDNILDAGETKAQAIIKVIPRFTQPTVTLVLN